MPLNFQTISVDMTNGIRRKQDDVLTTSIIRLENGRFSSGGVIEKRPGFSTLTGGNGVRLFSHKDALYQECDPAHVRAIQPSGDITEVLPHDISDFKSDIDYTIEDWYRAAPTSTPILPGSKSAFTNTQGFDMAVSEDGQVEMYAIGDDDGKVRFIIRNRDGTVLTRGSFGPDDTNAWVYAHPRIVRSRGSTLFVLFMARRGTGSMEIVSVAIGTGPTYTASAVQTVEAFATGNYVSMDATSAVAVDSANILVAYSDINTFNISVIKCSDDGLFLSVAREARGVFATYLSICSIAQGALLAWVENTNKVWSSGYNAGTDVFTTGLRFDHSADPAIVLGTAWLPSADTQTASLFENVVPTAGSDEAYVRVYSDIDYLNAVGGSTFIVAEGVLVAGRPAFFAGRALLPAITSSTFDDEITTGVLLDIGQVMALGGIIVGVTARAPAPIVLARYAIDGASIPSSVPLCTTTTKNDLIILAYTDDGETVGSKRGMYKLELDPTAQLLDAEAQGLTYLAGGCPHVFDGNLIVEEGFHHTPKLKTFTSSGGASGSPPTNLTSSKSYSYTAVYEWVDAAGNIHQSAPAPPVVFALAANKDIISFVVSTLRLTMRPDVKIVIYRTLGDGDIYLREQTLANSRVDRTVAVTSNLPDASLEDEQPLYITNFDQPSALENAPLPGCRGLVVHQNRLFTVGGRDAYEIQYTKEFDPGTGVEAVGPTQSFKVPQAWGRVSSLASMDDRLVMLCERGAGVLSGQGPDALGLQNGYSNPQLVSSDFWMTYGLVRAQALGDEGLWAMTYSGIRCLGRGLSMVAGQTGPIGAEVDPIARNRGNVVVVRSASRMYFLFDDANDALVWDRDFGQWSSYTNFRAQSAFISGTNPGELVFMDATSINYHEDGETTDDGENIPFLLETAWFKFTGVQGFQRVSRIMFLARGSTGTTIATVDLGVNYTSAYDDSLTTICLDGDEPWQFEHQPVVQKCESMRVKITMTSPGIFKLQNVTLKVGLKQGRFRLPNSGKV